MLTTVEVLETAMTLPATSVFVSAGKVIVAGWPTASFVASASAKPATTSSWCSESIVTKPDEDDDEPLPPPAADRSSTTRTTLLEELWPATLTVEEPLRSPSSRPRR